MRTPVEPARGFLTACLLTLVVGALASCGDADSSTAAPTSTDLDSTDPDSTEASQSVEAPDGADAPEWYGNRQGLPSCGVDEEYEDGYPNREARSCFQAAFLADEPAELTRLQYGDEGESIRAHFRVLGEGRYEIVGQQFPSPAGEEFGGAGWVRYDCERFVFLDDPGGEVDGVPMINAEGECSLVEEVEA